MLHAVNDLTDVIHATVGTLISSFTVEDTDTQVR